MKKDKTKKKKEVIEYSYAGKVSTKTLASLSESNTSFRLYFAMAIVEFTGCGFDKKTNKFLKNKNLTVNLVNIACKYIREKLVIGYAMNDKSLQVQFSNMKKELSLPRQMAHAVHNSKKFEKHFSINLVDYNTATSKTRYTANSQKDSFSEKLTSILTVLLRDNIARTKISDMIDITDISLDTSHTVEKTKRSKARLEDIKRIDAKLAAAM